MRRTRVAINMTPMIDVTFLLIIFFLVSSHLSKQENNVKLDLPAAANAIDANIAAGEHSVTVNILDDGTVQLGAAQVKVEELGRLLATRAAEVAGKLQVRVRCGKLSPYARVSPVLKACAVAQVTDVVFAVYDDKEGK